MNKKFVFSLFLIFICLFSCSSCFGASDHGFTLEFIESCVNNHSSEIKAFIEEHNCQNYLVSSCDNSLVVVRFSDGTFSLGSYIFSSTGVQGSISFLPDGSKFGTDWSSSNPGTRGDFYHASSQNELSSNRINSLDILMGFVEPEPVQPFIELSKTEYTENDSSVDLYVYPNGFDITNYGFTLYTIDDLEDYVPVIQYFSPGTQSFFDIYYNSGESRYEINLKDFFDFKFSDDINYQVGIYEYNVSGDNLPYALTDTFKIKFGDSYVVNPGGSFDITPKINVSTTESTTSVVVSITSDVPDSYIYYKIDDSSWHAYTEPINIDYNCTIYAHCWIFGGSSGYSSLTVNNIITKSEFVDGRPIINDSDISIIHKTLSPFDSDKEYMIEWYVNESNVNYFWFFSPDGINWFKFKEFADYNGGLLFQHYSYLFEVKNYPVILNFKYYDAVTGLYSDVLTRTITENSFTEPGVILPSYDEEDKYNPDDVIDFNDKAYIGSIDNGLDFSSSENLVESAKVSMESTWGLFATFFSLINGIWIFIPNEIMYLIVSLIIIKFIIAVIGFIRG